MSTEPENGEKVHGFTLVERQEIDRRLASKFVTHRVFYSVIGAVVLALCTVLLALVSVGWSTNAERYSSVKDRLLLIENVLLGVKAPEALEHDKE